MTADDSFAKLAEIKKNDENEKLKMAAATAAVAAPEEETRFFGKSKTLAAGSNGANAIFRFASQALHATTS